MRFSPDGKTLVDPGSGVTFWDYSGSRVSQVPRPKVFRATSMQGGEMKNASNRLCGSPDSMVMIQMAVFEMVDIIEALDHPGVVGHGDHRGLIFPGDFF